MHQRCLLVIKHFLTPCFITHELSKNVGRYKDLSKLTVILEEVFLRKWQEEGQEIK